MELLKGPPDGNPFGSQNGFPSDTPDGRPCCFPDHFALGDNLPQHAIPKMSFIERCNITVEFFKLRISYDVKESILISTVCFLHMDNGYNCAVDSCWGSFYTN